MCVCLYVSRSGWVLDGTLDARARDTPEHLNIDLRENIIFGDEFEDVRFTRSLAMCALSSDLKSHQDIKTATSRGAAGRPSLATLSTRQRMCLARAMYSLHDRVCAIIP